MRITQRLFLAALLLPPFAFGAASTKQEFTQVIAKTPDAAHGAELFEKCAACHGADGGGVIAGSTPRIAGQHYRVLVHQIVDFRHGNRWDFRMEGVATSHEVMPELQDIADVAWYVSTLERNGVRGVGDGQYVERGAALYQADCKSCHGAQGEGNNERDVPRIAGQHAAYLARQIYDAVDGRRPQLSSSHGNRFKRLSFAEVMGLSDFIARIGWKAEIPPPEAPPPQH
jgi:cytochrome c553